MTELYRALTLSGWLDAAFSMTLATGAVLLVTLLADLALVRRVSARWRAALYLAVFLRIALPASWASPLGFFSHEIPAPAPAHAAIVGRTEPENGDIPQFSASHAATDAPSRFALLMLGVAGALVAAAGAARLVASRALRHARPASARVAGLAAGARVLEHPTRGPAVYGLLRPRILVPTPLVERLDDDALGAVLRHEAAHVARRDPWRLALLQLATFIAWPLLPAWIAAWRVRGLMEQACDEVALAEAGAAQRRSYGEALLAVADWQPLHARLALGMLSFGGGLAPRLRALRFTRRWPVIAQVALIATLGCATVLASGERTLVASEPVVGAEPVESSEEASLFGEMRAAWPGEKTAGLARILTEKAAALADQGDLTRASYMTAAAAALDPSSPRPASALREREGAVVRMTEGITPPNLVERVEPPMGAELIAERGGVPGVVVLEIVIDETGRPVEPRILKSDDPLLSASALLAVERWRYRPAERDGKPIAVFLIVRVQFLAGPRAPSAGEPRAVAAPGQIFADGCALKMIDVQDGNRLQVSGTCESAAAFAGLVREFENAPEVSGVRVLDDWSGSQFRIEVQQRSGAQIEPARMQTSPRAANARAHPMGEPDDREAPQGMDEGVRRARELVDASGVDVTSIRPRASGRIDIEGRCSSTAGLQAILRSFEDSRDFADVALERQTNEPATGDTTFAFSARWRSQAELESLAIPDWPGDLATAAAEITPHLSPRGDVQVDHRSGAVIVRDTPEKLYDVRRLMLSPAVRIGEILRARCTDVSVSEDPDALRARARCDEASMQSATHALKEAGFTSNEVAAFWGSTGLQVLFVFPFADIRISAWRVDAAALPALVPEASGASQPAGGLDGVDASRLSTLERELEQAVKRHEAEVMSRPMIRAMLWQEATITSSLTSGGENAAATTLRFTATAYMRQDALECDATARVDGVTLSAKGALPMLLGARTPSGAVIVTIDGSLAKR